MVNLDFCRKVLDRLQETSPPAQPDDDSEFENWAQLTEIDSRLAGMLSTVVNSGSVDWDEVRNLNRELSRMTPANDEIIAWHKTLSTDVNSFHESRDC